MLKITEELGLALKNLRLEYGIKAVEIAREFNKTPAYISKLENAELKKIDFDNFKKIIEFITGSEDGFNKFASNIATKYSLEYTKEEIKQREWLMNIDTVMRKIPIPPELVKFINDTIDQNKLKLDDVVTEINANNDLNDITDVDVSKSIPNIWHMHENSCFIKFDLKLEKVKELLKMEISGTNYVTFEVILYSLFKLIGVEPQQARIDAENKLSEYRIYSIFKKREIMSKKIPQSELKNLLSSFDSENMELMNDVISAFKIISDINVKNSNETLRVLSNNLKTDIAFAFAYLGNDLTVLEKLDRKTKTQFLKDSRSLIKEYAGKVGIEPQIELFDNSTD